MMLKILEKELHGLKMKDFRQGSNGDKRGEGWRERVGRSRFGKGQAQTFVTGTDQSVNTKGEPGSIPHTAFQPR